MRAAGRCSRQPRIGLIDVASVEDSVKFERHPGWSASELRKIRLSALTASGALLGEPEHAPQPPRAPRFKVRYRYYCATTDCPGHDGQILDWELTALQNRNLGRSDGELQEIITEKFLTTMFGLDRQTSFFMGNFEDPRKRQNFSVLGAYYPPTGIASSRTLFDLDSDL